jgi:hypothetical protein
MGRRGQPLEHRVRALPVVVAHGEVNFGVEVHNVELLHAKRVLGPMVRLLAHPQLLEPLLDEPIASLEGAFGQQERGDRVRGRLLDRDQVALARPNVGRCLNGAAVPRELGRVGEPQRVSLKLLGLGGAATLEVGERAEVARVRRAATLAPVPLPVDAAFEDRPLREQDALGDLVAPDGVGDGGRLRKLALVQDAMAGIILGERVPFLAGPTLGVDDDLGRPERDRVPEPMRVERVWSP